MLDNPCALCGDNEAIDGFYCFGCGIDRHYSDMLDSELTLDWTE